MHIPSVSKSSIPLSHFPVSWRRSVARRVPGAALTLDAGSVPRRLTFQRDVDVVEADVDPQVGAEAVCRERTVVGVDLHHPRLPF